MWKLTIRDLETEITKKYVIRGCGNDRMKMRKLVKDKGILPRCRASFETYVSIMQDESKGNVIEEVSEF